MSPSYILEKKNIKKNENYFSNKKLLIKKIRESK